ncbi:ABC transporter permease subunit, partial [Collinsella aerofaciens]|uniref:ABC transporter permease subunit n=3 Tax=Coriobacteriaceae TaxID=84107 RepID=UPI00136C5792|nr:ABC transporter permease subunit [Collinsella aerofaciens]
MRAFARQMTERMKAVTAAGAVAAFWLAVWVFAAALVAQPLILPGPGTVAMALLRLVCDGGTWAILAGSGARILGGLALAAVCGGVLAGISSRSRAFARLVAPALSFVKATPVACVVVLLLIWLGSARVSIAAVFLMALPGVYFSLVEGLTQADRPLEQMFRLHGVRGWRLFCAHTWREVLPFALSCARAVIGMSWKAGVAAELIGMAVGTVGERIYQAKLLIETADLLAWTVLVVAASWACERVLVWLLWASGPVAWRAAVRAHGRG